MSAAAIEVLKKNVRTMNCTNCGAPIDLANSSACTHCGSAISMLDMNQAQQTLAQLQRAAEPHPINPALPFELEMAKRDAERSFGPVKSAPVMQSLGENSFVVREVLDAVSKWLNRI
jgi:hypothetical protein